MAIPRTVLFPNALQLRPAPNGCDPHLSIALKDGLLLLDLYGNFLLIGHKVELYVCSEPTLRNIVAVEAKQAEDDDGYVLYLLDVRGFLTTAHLVLPLDYGSENSLAVKIVHSVFLLSNATHMAFHHS